MPLIFVFLVGMGVALIRRRLVVAPADRTAGVDVPAQLLGWAVGLLSARRQEWGEAMVGELDRLDGRARRWRFAVGCVGAALVLPPWGRAAAAVGALTAVAAGAGGLAAYTQLHYRLGVDGWTWVGAAILVVVLVCYVLAGSALLRRPRSAGPGLGGGLLLTATWLVVSGFTLTRMITGLWSYWWLLIVVPVVLGMGGTLWGGSAAAGRRAVRLATVCAALGVYLYGVLAVAMIGASGHDPSDGWTDAQVVADRLGEQVVFYLLALPIMTVAIGWAAAAATARLRGAGPASRAPSTAASASPHAVLPVRGPDSAPTGEHRAATSESRPEREDLPVFDHGQSGDGAVGAIATTATHRRRTAYRVVLLCAAVVSVALLALTMLAK